MPTHGPLPQQRDFVSADVPGWHARIYPSSRHRDMSQLWPLRLPLHLYPVQNLAITGIRLRDPKDQLMLPFAIDDPGEDHGAVIRARFHVGIRQRWFAVEFFLNLLLNLPGGHLLRRRRFGIRRHGLGWRLSFGKGRWSAVPVVRRLLLLRRDCGNQHQQEPTKYASHTDLLILGCQVIRCRRWTWGALVSNRNRFRCW